MGVRVPSDRLLTGRGSFSLPLAVLTTVMFPVVTSPCVTRYQCECSF
jgi:hypothetical protein